MVAETEPAAPTTKPSVDQKLDDLVRDLKVKYLGDLSADETEEGKFDELYSRLESEYPEHLPLLMAKMKYMDALPKSVERLSGVIGAAEAIISRISEDELALNLGRKLDSEDGDAVKVRQSHFLPSARVTLKALVSTHSVSCVFSCTEQEREVVKDKKSCLIEALVRTALAYAESTSDGANDKFDETLKKLKALADIEAFSKYATLNIEKETRAGRYGLVLKQINKLLAKEGKEKDMILPLTRADLLGKRIALYEKLGYTVMVEYETRTRAIACPKSYAPF